MNRLSSYISNFDGTNLRRVRPEIVAPVWVVIGLVVIDVMINLLLAYPSDPKVTNPSALRLYFEYGRSAEGQLSRMTRPDRSETAPITLTGWYDPLTVRDFPSQPQTPIVSFYGMSHAEQLGLALHRVTNQFSPRIVAAPGATANWAYGAYLRDRGGNKSRAVVLAFMSNNLAMITTLSALTWSYDLATPYTTDRFYLDGDRLGVIHPPYTSFQQFTETFYDPKKWPAALNLFAKYDTIYNSFMMYANVLDHSSLFRLIRRAYGQRFLRSKRRAVLDETGFHPDSEQIRVAQRIIHEFAIQARSDGMIPVIYLVNNLGYSDYLLKALSPILRAENIPYLSSTSIVAPDDPRGYLPDSHFTHAVDDKMAQALIKLIEN